MKEENVILNKTCEFGLRVVKLYLHLRKNKVDVGLCSQLLNSGTSIGANVAEANQGQSRADFISKLSIALKECVETEYWIELLRDGGYLTASQAESLLVDCRELKAILTASIKNGNSELQ